MAVDAEQLANRVFLMTVGGVAAILIGIAAVMLLI